MHSILVTGSKGFIGKNLLKKVNRNYFNVLEFNRYDSLEILEKHIIESDFIIHLAGEVRPDSSANEFRDSNVSLTKSIINLLEKNNLKTPIIISSSIHAKLQKNEYGKTKRESELFVEHYALENDIKSIVYRLPHVFGEGCKPNYNSVITTWIYNSINNLEIKVFDRNIEMTYVYVQDIVNNILNDIKNNFENTEFYYEPKLVYNTTLGDIIDILLEFKSNINNKNYNAGNCDFRQKLFDTYIDYNRSLNVK